MGWVARRCASAWQGIREASSRAGGAEVESRNSGKPIQSRSTEPSFFVSDCFVGSCALHQALAVHNVCARRSKRRLLCAYRPGIALGAGWRSLLANLSGPRMDLGVARNAPRSLPECGNGDEGLASKPTSVELQDTNQSHTLAPPKRSARMPMVCAQDPASLIVLGPV